MTNSPDSFDFSELTPAQCVLLAEQLWEKARNHPEAAPITPDQRSELNARLDALDASQLDAPKSWDEVKYWLRSR